MLSWLIDNWYVVVGGISLLIVLGLVIFKFFGLPKNEKFKKVKGWLLAIVIEAEKTYGSKSGEAKLSYTYGLFKKQFPILSALVSYELFKNLVDSSLETMRELLSKSEDLKEYVDSK